jgi:hypothetical protein
MQHGDGALGEGGGRLQERHFARDVEVEFSIEVKVKVEIEVEKDKKAGTKVGGGKEGMGPDALDADAACRRKLVEKDIPQKISRDALRFAIRRLAGRLDSYRSHEQPPAAPQPPPSPPRSGNQMKPPPTQVEPAPELTSCLSGNRKVPGDSIGKQRRICQINCLVRRAELSRA